MQSLINIMECQLEEAFEAVAAAATGTGAGAGAGNRKQSISKRKASVAPGGGGEGGAAGGGGAGSPLNPKVFMYVCMCVYRANRACYYERKEGRNFVTDDAPKIYLPGKTLSSRSFMSIGISYTDTKWGGVSRVRFACMIANACD